MDAFDFGYAASEPAAAASASPSAVTIDARELLRLLRLPVDVSRTIASAAFTLKRVARGESLYRAGDPFHSLYVVRAGFFKTVHFDAGGTEQVMGFPIAGDLLGAEGLAEGVYAAEAIALEAGEVVIVPFARLRALARDCSGVETTR
jgi:CRP/FNR family transcriptional regulator, anaerobic regulatory protein